jgi:hypothetical protein
MSEVRFMRWRGVTWGAWSAVAATCVLYGVFAIAAGLGLVETEKMRTLPLPFQIHALSGGIALITGVLQFNPVIRIRFAQTHRWGGRIYVLSACMASIAAVLNAALFDVSWASRLSFFLMGFCWLWSTLVGYRAIRNRNLTLHREWMLRSFSLALFFVTFSFWVPVLAGNGKIEHLAYFLAVTMSWAFNVLCAELWLRRIRSTGDMSES